MYIGDWEIDATWADDSALWSRNEFRVGLGGEFLEIRTYAKDENDTIYQRYFTIFAYNKETQKLQSYGFTYDGTVTVVDDVKMEGSVSDATLTSQWNDGKAQIRQEIQIVSRDEYSWKVWSGDSDGHSWLLIMAANWRRIN